MGLMRWIEDVAPPAMATGLRKASDQLAAATDPDRALMLAATASIERARATWPDDGWRPGGPLRLLFAGYAGTRNTGADVRVDAMIDQFRHVLGRRNLEITMLTHDLDNTRGYFRTAHQVQMPVVFPAFLHQQVRRHHGVVACEGSMFKSRFADALSTFMVQALGLATATDRLAIAYGGEAGAMSPALEAMVARHTQGAWLVCRNEQSREVLGKLGLPTEGGTDTAWTFDPSPDAVGRAVLEAHGWDGARPVLVVCPIHAFWWPVRPDLGKAAQHHLLGMHREAHYRSVYFHHHGPDVARAPQRYLDGLAWAVRRFARQHDAHVAIVGMEQLDRTACEGLAGRLSDLDPGVLVSDRIDMFDLVAAIRQATWMVSSRYHGIVTCMPAGVRSVGVTMDERIRNLMVDRGTPELAVETTDPDLGPATYEALEIAAGRDDLVDGIERTVVRNLAEMGSMGRRLARHVRGRLPGFPLPEGMGDAGVWHHLPPLPDRLTELVARHGAPEAA